MNRNLKATKNNLIKKAYLSVVVAVMAGFALFTHQGTFMSESSVVCEAFEGVRRRTHLIGRKRRRNQRVDDFYESMKKDDKDNYERIGNTWAYIENVVLDYLEPKLIRDETPELRNNSLNKSIVSSIYKQVKESEEYKALREAIKDLGKAKSDRDYVDKAADLVRRLLNLQGMAFKSIVDMATILKLPQIKNPAKLEEVRQMFSDKSNVFSKYISHINLGSISKNEDILNEAHNLVKDALRLFLDGRDLNEKKVNDNSWNRSLEQSKDRSYHSLVLPLASALQALLSYNKQINAIFAMIGSSHLIDNYASVFSKTYTDAKSTGFSSEGDAAIMSKNNMFGILEQNPPSRDLLILPLLLASSVDVLKTKQSSDGNVNNSIAGLKSFISNNGSNLTHYLVEAFYNKKYGVNDVITTLGEVARRNDFRYGNSTKITYSWDEAFSEVLPKGACEDSLTLLDAVRLDSLNKRYERLKEDIGKYRNEYEQLQQKDNLTPQEQSNVKERMNELVSAMNKLANENLQIENIREWMKNKEYVDRFRFVGNGGELLKTNVTFDLSNMNNYMIEAMSTSTTLRLRVMMDCVIDSLKNLLRSGFRDSDYAFMDAASFSAALSRSVSWIKKIYDSAHEIISKVRKIKATDVKQSESSNSYSSHNEDISDWVPLDGGNLYLSSASAKPTSGDRIITVNSPSFVKGNKYRAILCPQGKVGEQKVPDHEEFNDLECTQSGCLEVPADKFKYKLGAAEIHFLSGDGNNTFLFKIYGHLGLKSIQNVRGVQAEAEFVANGGLNRDFEPRVYENSYGGLTIIISGSEIKHPYTLFFEKGASPNFEKDVCPMNYYVAEKLHVIQTKPLPKKSGDWELHVYNPVGEKSLESTDFLGKLNIHVDKTVSYDNINGDSSDKVLKYLGMKKKKSASDSSKTNLANISKKFKFEIHKDVKFSDDNQVSIQFVDSSGTVVHEQEVKLSRVWNDYKSNSDSSYRLYSGLLNVPQSLQSCTLYFVDGAASDKYDQLKSNISIDEKTAENTVIKMLGHDSTKDKD